MMKRPRIIGSCEAVQCINRALDYLAQDTLTACNGRYPWALWFVCKYLRIIEAKPYRKHGHYLGNGRAIIDPELGDDSYTYLDIAQCILHEACHGYWTEEKGTHRNSPEEEQDCRNEEYEFERRWRAAA